MFDVFGSAELLPNNCDVCGWMEEIYKIILISPQNWVGMAEHDQDIFYCVK